MADVCQSAVDCQSNSTKVEVVEENWHVLVQATGGKKMDPKLPIADKDEFLEHIRTADKEKEIQSSYSLFAA